MKVLFYTHPFYPLVGGLEQIALTLARGLAGCGHEVTVTTASKLNGAPELQEMFHIKRCANLVELYKAYKGCDCFVGHNISLNGCWPVFIKKKKTFIIHHALWGQEKGFKIIHRAVKRLLLMRAHSISVSRIVQNSLPVRSIRIANCYDNETYYVRKAEKKTKDVLFVGRLEPEKGCDLFVRAIERLKQNNINLTGTIIGNGSQIQILQSLIKSRGLEKNIELTGTMQGEQLAKAYNRHKLLIVPSRWREPFGIVALEGLACGCTVICSDGDGLEEAVGVHGCTFKKGCLDDLVRVMQNVLSSYNLEALEKGHALTRKYLEQYHPKTLVTQYDKILSANSI